MNIRPGMLVALVMTLALTGCGRKESPNPILIGRVVASIGSDQSASEHAGLGILLAVDEVNQGERIAGRPVEILAPECSSDRDVIRATALRLAAINKVVALIGGSDAAQVDCLSQVAESAQIPLVAAGGSSDKSGGTPVFHLGLAPSRQGRALARFAAGKLAAKSAVVLIGNREDLEALHGAVAGAFKREFKEKNGKLSGEWTLKNASDVVERIRAGKPDLVFLAGSVSDLDRLRQAGLDEKTVVLLAAQEGSLSQLAINPGKNPVCLATAFVNEANGTGTFVAKFRSRFKEAPDVHAALGYDCAQFLFEGLRQAKALEPTKILESFSELKRFESLSGPLSLDQDHWACRTAYVVRVENGKVTETEPIEPEASPN
jgi:branched-chain amino acid transport system substrate-binding protein